MSDWQAENPNRTRQRVSAAKQPLVVRHIDERLQLDEVLAKLVHLEEMAESARSSKAAERQALKLDARTIVAICAVLFSVAGYLVQDARNTSRQDAEIEATTVRVTNLEKIASINTEARVRTEVQLDELRQGQAEIKELLRGREVKK
jgi:hypothetical protein